MLEISAIIKPITLDSASIQESDKPYNEKEDVFFITSSTSEKDYLESQTATVSEVCKIANKNLRDKFISRFLQLIKDSDFEFGFNNPAEEYVRDALNRYGSFAREWINELFIQNFNDSYVTSSILRVLAHFDYMQVYPQGITMAVGATSHISADVRECGIRCFENWEAPENLNILHNLSYSETWLSEYLNDVIKGLESMRV